MPMIIPFFLMNRGCPHRCIYCNERLTAGDLPQRITEADFGETVRAHLGGSPRKRGPVQIAFYGGTFTGMPAREQRRLLAMAVPFLRQGAIDGIRLSTRPDEIDPAGAELLREFGVTTVEVGAQSLDDDVLERSARGHTAADTVRAVTLLRERGFETGVHLMAGLPGDSPERFLATVERTVLLRPDSVRIHPLLVLKETQLAGEFHRGTYRPLALSEAVDLCKNALKRLKAAGIPVIRLGLQTTRPMEEPGSVVAGPFHPAFRSLVESELLLEMAGALLATAGDRAAPAGAAAFFLSPADLSNFFGAQRKNVSALKARFGLEAIRVIADPGMSRLSLRLAAGGTFFGTDVSGEILEVPTKGLHPPPGHAILRPAIRAGHSRGQTPLSPSAAGPADPGPKEEGVFKSGFIGIIGRPNVGKSTLLNGVVGERIAITTHKPQTTRNRIMGIRNLPGEKAGQLIFLDTPGIHRGTSPLNRAMVEAATGTFGNVDLLLLIVEAGEAPHPDDRFIIDSLRGLPIPVFLVINKIDLVEKPLLLPLIGAFRGLFPFREILPVSALKGQGLDPLLGEIREILPEGPALFPEEMMTDRSERFIAAEIIREKITLLTRQEIPYASAVVVDAFREDEEQNRIRIAATIHVARDSQKGILIGKKGAMLKQIGTKARLEMERFFAAKIFLELFVRVAKDWTNDPKMLREFGYGDRG
jgi:GTP-binding protein Era